MTYSATDLQTLFSPETLARGRALANSDHIHSLEVRDSVITAVVVSESGEKVYRVYVRAENEMVAECSCGGSPACEHIAAALTLALNRQKQPAQRTVSVTRTADQNTRKTHRQDAASGQQLLYVLQPEPGIISRVGVKTLVVRKLSNGTFSSGSHYSPQKADKNNPARFLQDEDFDILTALAQCPQGREETVILDGVNSDQLLQAMIRSGRCHLQDMHLPALHMAAPRALNVDWTVDNSGVQHLQWHVAPEAKSLLALATVWYLDHGRQQCGEIQTSLPQPLLVELLNQPALSPQQATQAKTRIAKHFPAVDLPQLRIMEIAQTVLTQPTACLQLQSLITHPEKKETNSTPCAELYFNYDGIAVQIDTPATYFDGKTLFHIQRDREFEQQCRQRLLDNGLRPWRNSVPTDNDLYQLSTDPRAWIDFQYDVIPKLIKDRWQVVYHPDFELRAMQHQQWYCDTRRSEDKDWFEFTLGVYIDGDQINLLPVLLEFIKRHSPEEPLNVNTRHFALLIRERQWIRIPVERLQAIFNTLISLYAFKSAKVPQSLRLPLYQLANVSELISVDTHVPSDWSGDPDLQAMGKKLRNINPAPDVTAPEALNTALRPYQQSGLNWLQFLREQSLAGILADDMGLGKTVQTLASLLLEQQQGRMLTPSLIIAPTSLVFNWRNEISRLSPSLSVLCLHGANRQRHFTSIDNYDVVITSYALLIRDEEVLLASSYHYLILDEAHYIKNPKTKAARCVRHIKARHKLCLTGTPLENHLGELWSLFDFLLPGYLGTQKRFQALFRNPIEKQANTKRAEALARRVRPFMLRRTKDAVATELPEKTEIIHNIPLTPSQQDFYETVRLSVHRNVRSVIEREGLARSQITILDALLKLRQVCCDPRLVKLETPRQAVDSSKLLMLREMIPEMIEEGRRILVFSQFTSMLALIEAEMATLGIDYVKLTGETRDRAAPVERFQAREAPLFLISLKAGGVGLNLTAADTVIHYDPWWNPAVEQQATDRAHRIGQTQPVFVYKLICEGTVEEKILALQQNKKGLADSLFQSQNPQHFSEEDIDVLLAPLE